MFDGLKGEVYNFADVVQNMRGLHEGQFEEGAAEALVKGMEWDWEEELELLKEEVGLSVGMIR